ncbi:MAG: ribosome maturation factor RimM [Pseudomonadota bacterium]
MTGEARITVGEIRGVYGVRGWVKLFSWTRPRANLLTFSRFQSPDGRSLEVLESREQGKTLVARFAGIDDRDAALAMHGTTLTVLRDDLPDAEEDQYYWSDLIGATVTDVHRGEIGIVDHLIETGAHDVMVVKRTGAADELIPFAVGQVVAEVDIALATIVVDWPGIDGKAG